MAWRIGCGSSRTPSAPSGWTTSASARLRVEWVQALASLDSGHRVSRPREVAKCCLAWQLPERMDLELFEAERNDGRDSRYDSEKFCEGERPPWYLVVIKVREIPMRAGLQTMTTPPPRSADRTEAGMRLIAWIFGFTILVTPMVAHAQRWSGIVSPSRAMDWSTPGAGVAGGISNRTTVCATLNPGATTA